MGCSFTLTLSNCTLFISHFIVLVSTHCVNKASCMQIAAAVQDYRDFYKQNAHFLMPLLSKSNVKHAARSLQIRLFVKQAAPFFLFFFLLRTHFYYMTYFFTRDLPLGESGHDCAMRLPPLCTTNILLRHEACCWRVASNCKLILSWNY